MARAVGRWTGKARAYMRNFTAELERESQLGEMRKQLEEARSLLQQQSQTLDDATRTIANQARALPEAVKQDLNAAASPGAEPKPEPPAGP